MEVSLIICPMLLAMLFQQMEIIQAQMLYRECEVWVHLASTNQMHLSSPICSSHDYTHDLFGRSRIVLRFYLCTWDKHLHLHVRLKPQVDMVLLMRMIILEIYAKFISRLNLKRCAHLYLSHPIEKLPFVIIL